MAGSSQRRYGGHDVNILWWWATLVLLTLSLLESVQAATVAPTDSTTENTTSSSTEDDTTSFNLLIYFPQSAISLFSLGCFIGISMLVAMLAEKCYERLSLRDDSSDMSEHTKEILKARILGMVFGKKLNLNTMTDKQRALELAKKYGHIWQYRAAMRKKKRLHEQKELKKRRSSLFGNLFASKTNEAGDTSRPKSSKDRKSLTKKPSVSTIIEQPSSTPAAGSKRDTVKEEFVSVDMKPVPKNTTTNTAKIDTTKTSKPNVKNTSKQTQQDVNINMDNITQLKTEDPDEFDVDDSMPSNNEQAKQQHRTQKANSPAKKSTNPALVSEGSMYKYMRTRPPSALSTKVTATTAASSNVPSRKVAPLTRQPSRPLTAGGSRPITAGAKRGTTDKDYKTQGKSVRNELFKNLVP